jgi:hypothetical protein
MASLQARIVASRSGRLFIRRVVFKVQHPSPTFAPGLLFAVNGPSLDCHSRPSPVRPGISLSLSDLKALRRALTRRLATYALLASLSAIALYVCR